MTYGVKNETVKPQLKNDNISLKPKKRELNMEQKFITVTNNQIYKEIDK